MVFIFLFFLSYLSQRTIPFRLALFKSPSGMTVPAVVVLRGVRRFFYFSHTIKSVFLRSYVWHLDLSMPWASRAGRSVSSLSKSQKQASTLPLCPQFSPAHRRTTCAGLLFISFMAFLVYFFQTALLPLAHFSSIGRQCIYTHLSVY